MISTPNAHAALTQAFASRNSGMKASEIRELLKLLNRPEIISFAGGIPDPDLFPHEAFSAAYARALSPQNQAASLQYSTSEGHAPLREWIAAHMASLGVPCSPDNVLITSGSQQALDYLGKLFLDPKDTALIGWPTYLGALGAFNAYQPRYDRLDPRRNLDPAQFLADAAAAGGRIKFAYLSTDFANPTGVTLSLSDRRAVLALADDLDCAVIEDAAYQALRFDGENLPPMLALEIAAKGSIEACRTIYCGSFSKTLSPGLRLGYVVAAQPVISQLVLMKQAGDLHSSTLNQIALTDVATALFDTHILRLRDHYRTRRDAMAAALHAHMPAGVTWNTPEGGMFFWLTLPDHMNGSELLKTALEQVNVAFVPGGAFFADGSGANTIRLNFSSPDVAKINDGVARLGGLLTSLLA